MSKIRDHLNSKNKDLYSRFRGLEIEARKLLEFSQGGKHLFFTTHGNSHIEAVERNYDWLLSDDDIESFTAAEAFVLLCATYLHDVFMIPTYPGDEVRARAEHAKNAKSTLLGQKNRLGLSQSEAVYIGEVIRGHHVETIAEIDDEGILGNDRVNLKKLGACLSMADICHADGSRAPMIAFEYLTLDDESQRHWKRHMQISGLNREHSKIRIAAISFSDEGAEAVREYGQEIEKQLERIKPFFSSELSVLDGVTTSITPLESEYDQDLTFRTDVSSIIGLLVDGLYKRNDVFIRELVQNSLDAVRIEAMHARKQGIPYRPKIVLSYALDDEGDVTHLRVDDNGDGMNLSEVKGTLLSIGQSRNSSNAVQSLLQENDENLVSSFGIGLLTCFKVSRSLTVRTQKGTNGQPFELSINGPGEAVDIAKSQSEGSGTSVILEISDTDSDLWIEDSLGYYFRYVRLCSIHFQELDIDEISAISREEIFDKAALDANSLTQERVQDSAITIEGNGFFCCLTAPWRSKPGTFLERSGELNVLNEGIYIQTVKAVEWLPAEYGFFNGFVNLSAKSVDLQASRDAIKENDRLDSIKSMVFDLRFDIAAQVAALSRRQEMREATSLVIAQCSRNSTGFETDVLRSKVGSQTVLLTSGESATLEEIAGSGLSRLYLHYDDGRFVHDLTVFDGTKIFEKGNNVSEMQATVLSNQGETVLSLARFDREGPHDNIMEASLVRWYMRGQGISVIDLTKASGGIDWPTRSVPRGIRSHIGRNVKFIEPNTSESKVGWLVEDEVWLNLSNPKVRNVFNSLRRDKVHERQLDSLKILIMMIECRFDEVLNFCVDRLLERN